MIDEFTIEQRELSVRGREHDLFVATLSINMQTHLDVYIEPVEGQPETYENEEKEFLVDRAFLLHWIDLAIEKAQDQLQATFIYFGFEVEALSCADVRYFLYNERPPGESDTKYDPSEDVYMAYYQMAVLWKFVFDARCLL